MKNISKLLILMMAMVSALAIQSCEEEEDPGIVNFVESSINRTTDDLSDITVEFSIDPPAPQNSEFTVALTGAEAGTVFSTTPAISDGEVVVTVNSGATDASFTVSPIEEGIGFDDVVLNMELVSAGSGLTTGLTTVSVINITNARDTGEELPFTEDFDGCAEGGSGEPIPEGWSQEVIQQNAEGSAVWSCVDAGFFGFEAVQANAFVPGSDDQTSSEVWLVSPRINLLEATDPQLSFGVDRRFPGTGDFPEPLYDIVISTDYNGLNFDDATWTRFEPGFAAMTANDPGQDDLTNTGDLSLADYTGEVIAFAFVYRAGAPASFDATILRIGNVAVTD